MQRGRTKAIVLAIVLVAAAGAAMLRLPVLFERPMHGDEANQAYKFGILLETGSYRYDPEEHHGPTLYYATLPSAWTLGHETFAETHELTYRIVPLVFGIGLVFVLLLLYDGLGWGGVFWTAVFTAVSHAMVFYSGYYIQEMLLVFFTALALGCGWRYYRRPTYLWAILAGIALGLMHATKETCVLVYAAMAGGLALTWTWRRLAGRRESGVRSVEDERTGTEEYPLARHIAALLVAAALVSVTLFSSFFTHWRGPLDSILTYQHYLVRSEGMGHTALHEHPWHYYLKTLIYTKKAAGPWWSEAPLVALALAGAVAALWPGRRDKPLLLPFLAFYTLLLTLAYSGIAYKTPWNMLSFLHGMILLAGIGAAALVRRARWRPLQFAAIVLIAAGAAHLAVQSYKGITVYAADPRNPYVYAHTHPAAVRMTDRIHAIAALHPEHSAMRVDIIAPDGDYWPLPYYLRGMAAVGYWLHIPDPLDAPVFVVPTALHDEVLARVGESYQMEFYALRPGVLRLLFIRNDLWETFMEGRQ
jgi:uncharacterized protein (TIGR03663 family)